MEQVESIRSGEQPDGTYRCSFCLGLLPKDGGHICGQPALKQADPGRRSAIDACAMEFWERVYIAALEIAQRQANPQVPWSERCGEIADHAVERWRERFDKAGE